MKENLLWPSEKAVYIPSEHQYFNFGEGGI